jgi:hypothetical protein
MNITLIRKRSQVIAALALTACLTGGAAKAETFTNLETVTATGGSAWTRALPLTLTGVLLTDPDEMLDGTPNFLPWNSGANMFQLGGQWQVFVQAVAAGDRGGVECWMGQNYGNLPWEPHDGSDSYSNPAWSNEVYRVSHDAATGLKFQRGDLVSITAQGSLFHGGMQNVNEEHVVNPNKDFTLTLLLPGFGLPAPEVISLASVISTNITATGYYDIFDAARATGGEFYQGMRVRINGLTLVTTGGWNTNADWSARHCTATDGEGRQFPLVHPLYDLGPAPTSRFDAVGVFLQESGSDDNIGTYGYKLYVQEVTFSAEATLSIANKPVITWPAALGNYQLQSGDSPTSTNWAAVTNVPALLNGQNTVIVEPTAAERYYRLQRIR